MLQPVCVLLNLDIPPPYDGMNLLSNGCRRPDTCEDSEKEDDCVKLAENLIEVRVRCIQLDLS